MLTSLRLKDWKSFGDGPAMPFAPLTLLVGPNGSGKSNLLDALRFLQGAALDLPLRDVLRGRYEGQREIWPGIRGHVAEAARIGAGTFGVETEWKRDATEERHKLIVSLSPDVIVALEHLSTPARPIYGVHTSVGPNHLMVGMNGAVLTTSDGTSTVADPSRLVLGQVNGEARGLHAALREIVFLDVQPARMRDYRPEGYGQLGVNGENISPVLRRLSDNERQDVVDWLAELCAPAIEGIAFDRTQLGEVMMFLVEHDGAKISARSISDGTLRFLGLVAALLTAPKGSMIIVEEPDVGLHPARVRLLADLLQDTIKRRSLQVIATTHSPTLLAHLSPLVLADVLAFGRDPETGATIGKRIGDLPHFGTFKDSTELEHLVSTGWLERAL